MTRTETRKVMGWPLFVMGLLVGVLILTNRMATAQTNVLLNRVLRLRYLPSPDDMFYAFRKIVRPGTDELVIGAREDKYIIWKGIIIGENGPFGRLNFIHVFERDSNGNERLVWSQHIDTTATGTNANPNPFIFHFDDGIRFPKNTALVVKNAQHGGNDVGIWGYYADVGTE